MMMMMMMMSTIVVFIISDPGLNLCIFFRTACASQYQKSREIVPEYTIKYQVYSSSQGCHTATETHMPHGITQCYLPPGRGDIPALV